MTDLTTDELNSLTMFRSGYKGAYPLNMMPEPKSTTDRPFSFIFNSDPDFLKGQHWMLICLPPDGSRGPLFIDPLGVKLYIRSNLIRKSVVDYVESFEDLSRLQEVPFACQNPFSLHCGQFCAFILSLLPMYSYNIHNLFANEFIADDSTFNDKKIMAWYATLI